MFLYVYRCCPCRGTSIRVCLARHLVTNVIHQQSFPTSNPAETLQHALDLSVAIDSPATQSQSIIPLCRFHNSAILCSAVWWISFRLHPIVSLGIGTFGPADVHVDSSTYGRITSTPKTAWKDCDVMGFFSSLNVPIRFDTDVNAAALGELRWGGHETRLGRSVRHLAYVTVGTGVGVGIVLGGLSVVGQMHPEAGHIRVPHHSADTYSGNWYKKQNTVAIQHRTRRTSI